MPCRRRGACGRHGARGSGRGSPSKRPPPVHDAIAVGTAVAGGRAGDAQAIARIEHAERVADLRTLMARERRDLYLQALGYSYDEIAARSDGVVVYRRQQAAQRGARPAAPPRA